MFEKAYENDDMNTWITTQSTVLTQSLHCRSVLVLLSVSDNDISNKKSFKLKLMLRLKEYIKELKEI